MTFKEMANIIMNHCIDRDSAENIAQDIMIALDEENNVKENVTEPICSKAIQKKPEGFKTFINGHLLCSLYDQDAPDYEEKDSDDNYAILARMTAAKILSDFEFYGDMYYRLEDWLTDLLLGNDAHIPIGIEYEYLKCALRVEIRDFFESRSCKLLEADDIEEVVERLLYHCSENVLNMNFISDIVDEYLLEIERESE